MTYTKLMGTSVLILLAACVGCARAHSPCDDCTEDAGGTGDGGASDADVDAGCLCDPDAGPTSPVPSAACDDGNACTRELLEDGTCVYRPVDDGTACEDGDLCTLGDHCASSVCVAGLRAAGELARVGQLDAITGKVVTMAPGRFVAFSTEDILRGRVQSIVRVADGLEVQATWEGDLSIVTSGVSDILAAVDADGTAVVGGRGARDLRLFSVGDTTIEPRGRVADLSGQIVSLDLHGDRVWLCTRDFFAGNALTLIDVSDLDAPVEVGGVSLGSTTCGSVAVNADGSRVYANTAVGVRYIDATPLDTGGDPTLSDVIADTAAVAIDGASLILTTPTTVRVLNESDHAERFSVAIAGVHAASLFGNRLIVEGSRAAGSRTELFASVYDVTPGSEPSRSADVVVGWHLGAPAAQSYRSATDGATLIASARSRVFDLRLDRLDELFVPALVSLRDVMRTATGVRVYDRSGAAAIDVSDLANPAYVGGGSFGDPAPVIAIAVDASLVVPRFVTGVGLGAFDDTTRVVLQSSNSYYPSPFPIQRWTFDDAGRRTASSAFSIRHQGATQLTTAGDFLYAFQFPQASGAGAHIAAYYLPAIGDGGAVEPAFGIPVSASSATQRGFDVDARTRVAVVSTEVEGGPALAFYDFTASPPVPLRTIATDSLYRQLRIVGDRVVAVNTDAIVFFDAEAGVEASRVAESLFGRQILAFDGTVAYVGQLTIVPGDSAYEVVAVPFGESSVAAVVEVNALPKSLAELEDGLVLGFESQLITVHPHCPAR